MKHTPPPSHPSLPALALACAIAVLMLSSCPQPQPEAPAIEGVGTATFDLSSQSVLHLDFMNYEALDVTLADPPRGTLYLGKSNISSAAVAAGSTGFSSQSEKGTSPQNHGFLMDKDREASRLASLPKGARSSSPKAASIPFGDPPSNYIVDSTTRDFWIESKGVWKSVGATLRYISHTAYLWIPDGYYKESELIAAPTDNRLTKNQINALGDAFSGSDPWTGSGIRALISNLYGTEWGGEPGGSGGIDGDQHIHILLYDLEEDYDSAQTGGLLGYFWPWDEYSATYAETYKERSNEAQMFYLDVHLADRFPGTMRSTLAHEYQHMIYEEYKNSIGDTWFNEMLSMLGEEFVESYVQDALDPYSVRERLETFKPNYYASGVTDWLRDDPLKSYASAYAFGAYMARNYGGVRLLRALGWSGKAGKAAIDEALDDLGYPKDFDAVVADYISAFVLKNPAPAGGYSFPAAGGTLDGVSYSVPGFSLPDANGAALKIFAPGEQGALRPYGQSLHSASSWKDPRDGKVVRVTRPGTESVSLALVFSRQ